MSELINPNPEVHAVATGHRRSAAEIAQELDETQSDPVDAEEVFQLVRTIMDPEHPNTLEQLNVVNAQDIVVDDAARRVRVLFTPTVPHCSMTTLIGLCIRVKLQKCLSSKYKVDVKVAPGTHNQEVEVNKQLGDKERVAAALESKGLSELVFKCLHEMEEP